MREFQLLTIAECHAHIAPLVDAALGPQGFVNVRPMRWVNSSAAPIRRIFEYWQLGSGLSPRWGYSFDAVPHLAGGKPKWHRTEKSALLDAFVDGQGAEHNLSYIGGVDGLLTGMPEKVHAAIAQAQAFWQAAPTPARVFAQVIEMAEGSKQRPMQLPLHMAAAMCHAFAGREEQGRKELALFISRGKAKEEAVPKLSDIFEGWLRDGYRPGA